MFGCLSHLAVGLINCSLIGVMFYSSDDISDFRHEAFLEECGLDPSDFD